jgi:hypothetical protein
MKMRLGVAKRRLFGSWLVISAIWVAGVGYLARKGKDAQEDRYND